jgi:hypothetical protein
MFNPSIDVAVEALLPRRMALHFVHGFALAIRRAAARHAASASEVLRIIGLIRS